MAHARLHIPSWKSGFAHNAAESANPGLWKGLVGLWLPALGPTGLTLRDMSGWGNHGTLTNMDPATDWVTIGKRGLPWALDFDGSNDYVDCGNSSILNPTSELSLIAWVMWDAMPVVGDDWIISRDDNVLGRSYSFGAASIGGTTEAELQINGAATIRNLGPSLVANTWYQMVATGNSGEGWQLYLNGTKVASVGWAAPNATTGATNIGRRTYATSKGYSKARIATVTIYLRHLVAFETQQLYADPLAMLRRRVRVFPAAVAAGFVPYPYPRHELTGGLAT